MATASDTGLFEVMEVDDTDGGELILFAEDQDNQGVSLDIDLSNNDNKRIQQRKRKRTKTSRIEVVVRKRPMNSKEIENGETDIGKVYPSESRITICEPRLKVDLTKFTQYHDFKFDHCFNETVSNKVIYETCVKPLFNTILKVLPNNKFAGKATCFGYGQTGSGKTYTLLGSMDNQTGKYTEGLYAMAVRDLFKYLPSNNQIIVSFYEIYGGKLFDLLADRKQILCREDGKQKVNIIGLKRIKCDNAEFLMNIIMNGNSIRQTGSTGANNTSSRSHAILSLDILPIRGRLSFIDLAGSERGADTQNNDKQTRIEGAEINKSLLALKECIRALDQNSIHKPFRGSKLTQVLKESFIGNSRTLMIANISPNSGSCENTLNTLRYAYRVKELKSDNNKSSSLIPDNSSITPSLSRNQSAPSLPTYKPPARPSTAQRRRNNQGSLNQNNVKNKKRAKDDVSYVKSRERSKLTSSNSNNNPISRTRNNSIRDNSNNRYSSGNRKGNNNDAQKSKSNNNSEYVNMRNRERATKRRKLHQQNQNQTQSNMDNKQQQNQSKKIKPSPPKTENSNLSSRMRHNHKASRDSIKSEAQSESLRPQRSPRKRESMNIKRNQHQNQNKNLKVNRSPRKERGNTKEQRTNIPQKYKRRTSQGQGQGHVMDNRDNDNDVAMNDNQNQRRKSESDIGFNINIHFSKKQLIKAHRKHIDEFMILIKEDMQLLKGFDKDEFNNEEYQKRLMNVLQKQQNAVKKYRAKVFNN